MRRRYAALLAVAVLVAALGFLRGPAIWNHFTVVEHWDVLSNETIVVRRHGKFSDEFIYAASWSIDSGHQITEQHGHDGLRWFWHERLGYVIRNEGEAGSSAGIPEGDPKPTAPWLDRGMSAEEWWSRVRPEDGATLAEALAAAKAAAEAQGSLFGDDD